MLFCPENDNKTTLLCFATYCFIVFLSAKKRSFNWNKNQRNFDFSKYLILLHFDLTCGIKNIVPFKGTFFRALLFQGTIYCICAIFPQKNSFFLPYTLIYSSLSNNFISIFSVDILDKKLAF